MNFNQVKAKKHWVYTAAGIERSKRETGNTERREGEPIDRKDPTYCSQHWIDMGWVKDAGE